ncbi:MAG: hypothetical protein ACAF41_11460 [Leptolyngbya sp. BL-A-14]
MAKREEIQALGVRSQNTGVRRGAIDELLLKPLPPASLGSPITLPPDS